MTDPNIVKERKNSTRFKGILLILTIITAVFNCCEGDLFHDCLHGRGKLIEEQRELYPFNNIAVFDNISLVIEQGNRHLIILTTGKHLMPLITTSIAGQTLEIRNEAPCKLLKDPWNAVEARLVVPHFDTLWINNQQEIRSAGTITQKKAYIQVGESCADVHLDFHAEFVRVDNLKGTATINLSGQYDTLLIYHISAGTVRAYQISSEVVIVNTGSVNDVYTQSGNGTLDVKITGPGNVYYRGHPSLIRLYQSGSGRLIWDYTGQQ